MNKRAFVTCVLAGEAAAIALTLTNTYVPGKLIDSLVYGATWKIYYFLGVSLWEFFCL